MGCFKPLDAWSPTERSASGKRIISFNKNDASPSWEKLRLPCGQCIGCRLDRSRSWAIRCLHEAQGWDDNCFITLTYSNEHLPGAASLVKKDFQDFMKRLRKEFVPTNPFNRDIDKDRWQEFHEKHCIRFFHAGEYGVEWTDNDLPIEGSIGRPHYHAIIFNHDFKDKIHYCNRNDTPLFISPTLSRIWGMGFCSVGTVTFESAAYVARYIMKKVTGDLADDHYAQLPHTEEYLRHRVDPSTGEIFRIQEEYTTMSRRPGIGRRWIEKYIDEVFPDDFVSINGQKLQTPGYYRDIYQERDPEAAEALCRARLEKARENPDNAPHRLEAREKVAKRKLGMLPRNLKTDEEKNHDP